MSGAAKQAEGLIEQKIFENLSLPKNRFALIIANYEFYDPEIGSLAAPKNDAENLYDVLSNPNIGAFEATKLINENSITVKKAIYSFFTERKKDDTLLLYYTGHGIKGDDANLYFVTSDTERKFLPVTSVSASYVKERMGDSFSKRQILILDCCYGGSFMRDWEWKADKSICARDLFGGEGRVVLTAADSMQYSFEGERREGEAVQSIYTCKLVEGLKSGDADSDRDGFVSQNDLQSYLSEKVREITPNMSPQIDSLGVKGDIIIALNPNPKPAELSMEIQDLLKKSTKYREFAVSMLEELLHSEDRCEKLAAYLELQKLTKDDSKRVSEKAIFALQHRPNDLESSVSDKDEKKMLPLEDFNKNPKCPACGKTHRLLLRYCPETGSAIGKVCPNCNHLNLVGAKYCGKCTLELQL